MCRHPPRALLIAAFLLAPTLGSAQVRAELHLDLPVVLPPLVVISPGVQVVPDVNEEVFFHDGYYWCRRDGRWWRSRHHREGWVLVERGHIPPGLARIPPGQYRKWHGPPHGPRPAGYQEGKKERHERMKEEKRERKEERKEEKREGKGHGRGQGRGD